MGLQVYTIDYLVKSSNMGDISKFELCMLRDYFQNIIWACENKKVDERPYIKGVAESGMAILHGLWHDGKSYV